MGAFTTPSKRPRLAYRRIRRINITKLSKWNASHCSKVRRHGWKQTSTLLVQVVRRAMALITNHASGYLEYAFMPTSTEWTVANCNTALDAVSFVRCLLKD